MFLNSFTKISQISLWCLTIICSIYHLPNMPETYSHSMVKRPSDSFSNHITRPANVHMPGWPRFVFGSYEQFPNMYFSHAILLCHLFQYVLVWKIPAHLYGWFLLSDLFSFFLLDSFIFQSLDVSESRKKWLPHYIYPF